MHFIRFYDTCILSTLVLTLSFCKESDSNAADSDLKLKRPGDNHKADHFDKYGQVDDEFDHEAIIGSKIETEAYKALEPAVAKQRLRELVTKMDANKNGTVERGELEHWIVHSFKTLDIERSAQLFESKDDNKDGFLGWDELLYRVFGYKTEELKQLENDTSIDNIEFLKIIAEDKLKFEHADLDKNGKLDKNEYAAYYSPQYYAYMAPVEAKSILQRLDTNKDGFLFENEFLSTYSKGENNTKERDHEIEMFKKYDANKDKKLDIAELTNWISEGSTDNAKLETNHLFRETDANKNGVLTPDEIVDQADLWVGSQATDYGVHLTSMDQKKEL